MDALRFERVNKAFGPRIALRDVSFSIPRGVACAFIGPNGAGKTTTFSIIGGFLPHDSGQVQVLGEHDTDPAELKGKLGILPQDAELGARHTPHEWLVHLGMLAGLSHRNAELESDHWLDHVGLSDRRSDRIGRLSHGMRRRVAVASALVGSPPLVLLDEPTAGLDPAQAASLRALLSDLKGKTTLVVSSHNLGELETFCDYVVMMNEGHCIFSGTLEQATRRGEALEWVLSTRPDLDAMRQHFPLHRFELTEPRDVFGWRVRQQLAHGDDPDAVVVTAFGWFVARGLRVRELHRGVRLEAEFLERTSRTAAPRSH